MLQFFDYVFYRACEFYKKKGEGPGFSFSGLLVISTVQGFNLFSILFGTELFLDKKIEISKFYTIVCLLVLLVINGIHYNKIDYTILKEKWEALLLVSLKE